MFLVEAAAAAGGRGAAASRPAGRRDAAPTRTLTGSPNATTWPSTSAALNKRFGDKHVVEGSVAAGAPAARSTASSVPTAAARRLRSACCAGC
ncbi:MAG: hypothetical protein MZW92_50150 [Comamonadaceae bacterium]|nr:hypothetical protein [Comamonadaceae bacterium]